MARGQSVDPMVERVWDDQVIVAKEFARLLRVGLRTLYRWAQTGRVPKPVRLGGALCAGSCRP